MLIADPVFIIYSCNKKMTATRCLFQSVIQSLVRLFYRHQSYICDVHRYFIYECFCVLIKNNVSTVCFFYSVDY